MANPSFSIVIPAHNQAPELRRHLPAVLEQDYDDFEVIVVDIASTDETKDVLEAMELRYPTLRHTHTPSTARDISLERLALTLGIRSARHEWVVITHANCRPATDKWLSTIAEEATESRDILVGVAKYDEGHHRWFDRKVGFLRLWQTLANLDHIRAGHAAVRCDGCNVTLRRSLFLGADAFGDHLNLQTGAEELLVNRLSTRKNTAVVDAPEGIVIEDRLAARRLWKKQRVFYVETCRHQRHTFLFRLKLTLRLLLPWLMLAGFGALWLLLNHLHPEEREAIGAIMGLTALLLLILTAARISHWNRAARRIGYERNYHLTFPLFVLALPLWNISARLTHLVSPKAEFRKKFV